MLFRFGFCGLSVPSRPCHSIPDVLFIKTCLFCQCNKLAAVCLQIIQVRFSIKILVLCHFGAFLFLSWLMHELRVFALIFRLTLMKSTMMSTQCVLHTLYHHMSEPRYIFIINYFTPTVLLCPDNVTNGICSSSFYIFSCLVFCSLMIMFL